MALCSWNKDLVWMELRLAGVRPKNFSAYPSSLLFLGKIVSPVLELKQTPPMKKKQHHVQSLHSWGWCRGAVSGFHHPPLLFSPFILEPFPFPETLRRNTCEGLNLVHCFHSSLPHLDSCGVGPVSECNSVSFMGLSFHWCQRGDDT